VRDRNDNRSLRAVFGPGVPDIKTLLAGALLKPGDLATIRWPTELQERNFKKVLLFLDKGSVVLVLALVNATSQEQAEQGTPPNSRNQVALVLTTSGTPGWLMADDLRVLT
jgi:hypothetical protein